MDVQLFVFFMCVFMSRIPVSVKVGPLYTVISRKVSSLSSHSWVNLMVGWVELILPMKVSRSSSEPVQMMKISSIYLPHIDMVWGVSLEFWFQFAHK